ncbi:MAG TPA: FixH family protein [Chitinophagales bacterium]|nr:FixH family protein [Chitinophagales bacterium]
MKKFNWGWGITIFYCGFVVFMVMMVFKTRTVKDDLVTPEYYAKELQYQQHIDKQKRASELKEQPVWQVNGKEIAIKFPKEQALKNLEAEILFYNNAEAKKDFKINCIPDSSGMCLVDTRNLQHGAYQIQIDWKAGNESYYNEGTINIQ